MNNLSDFFSSTSPITYYFSGKYWSAKERHLDAPSFEFECEFSNNEDYIFAFGDLSQYSEEDIPGFTMSIPRSNPNSSVVSFALTLPVVETLEGRAFFTGSGMEVFLRSDLATLFGHLHKPSPTHLWISGIFQTSYQCYGFVVTGTTESPQTKATNVVPFIPPRAKP